ncbi:MAG: acetyl-CoA carboxylase biotin carboxyl carrier protein [Flavobacteriales bacterium]|jgi:acetyl-CoA carboxylase biotin carboxyl carrier protein|nr:acetyl-CoA carboxylase biotin carboxyl carrier protein [Flavobacteriales bacterium]MBT3573097.1 acetyl-CoA carboxylase biotin carboxyl carrier protein [Flavobacteriales bacterium]MBT3677631.1 acetyl-CoA carboxylase biotin carboxyl carrier protein [Flavobacteriales bacterium]MBT3739457.1 acetyl-CoA carboxylase biotin carboxyl carrier protein [Flavobacteriales bacterium]MBT4528952.1 acetyl-CoA carboxylase biotin carboxyl carrier protein [Flavobacteriales bacterium]
MNQKELQSFIKFVSKSGISEVALEMDDFKVTIKTGTGEAVLVQAPAAAAPTALAAPAAPAALAAPAAADEFAHCIAVKSPMIGTFYRRPSPDKDIFVNIGDVVAEGDCVCIIEAMKLFNEIESEIAGKIVKVLVEDGSPVEYDQPLFLVDPS